MLRWMAAVLFLSFISCNARAVGARGHRQPRSPAPEAPEAGGESAAGLPQEGRTSHKVTVQGTEREYVLYSPPSLPSGTKVPLMIVLHGGMGNAEAIEKTTAMDAVAAQEQFFVAYPEGTEGSMPRMKGHRTWNAGACCGIAVKRDVDDVAFISAMIDAIAASHPVDVKRVYATGMSNGAMMAYRLACEAPQKIAAVIPVSGTLSVNDATRAKDVAVLHIHGDKDENVPFNGGVGDNSVSGVEHRSVADTMEMIVAPRKSSGRDETEAEAGTKHYVYRCAEGAPVELIVVQGGGHSWPGGARGKGAGSALNASEKAWTFAKQFSK